MALTVAKAHEAWAPLIVFVLSFGESLAFVSLVLPATAFLFGVGGLAAASGIAFWSVWAAAAHGAVAGDWASYWLGYYFKDSIGQAWPLFRYPKLLPKVRLFSTNGASSAFLGPVLRTFTLCHACRRRPLRDAAVFVPGSQYRVGGDLPGTPAFL
jgi:membrane protein DedA with SNARE-associated domain